MCVIIEVNPGAEIPFDKLASACVVNAHGWGAVVADRGHLEIRKRFLPNGNDPEEIARFLEDTKDVHTYLHLRYQTVGDKSLASCHPFCVTGKKKENYDVFLMHNGTLFDFKKEKSDRPDSYHLARGLVRPLFQRFASHLGPEQVLKDPLFKDVLEKYVPKSQHSIVLIVDQENNVLTLNRDKGKQFDGWWASNEYSFNRDHREKTTTTYKSTSYRNYMEEWGDDDPLIITGAPSSVVYLPGTKETKELTPPQPRATFLALSGLNTLKDVSCWSPDTIQDLVEEYPFEASILILDLLKELYSRK